MGIMCLACLFSFWVGKNVGTVQAQKQMDTEVSAMENVEVGSDGSEAMLQGDGLQTEAENQGTRTDGQTEDSPQTGHGTQGADDPGETDEESKEEDPFPDLDKSEIVLVNKDNKLPDDYEVELADYGKHKIAAEALAEFIPEDKLSAEYIIPKAFEEGVGKAVADAVADAARRTGVARI
jgi:hypothetical protein